MPLGWTSKTASFPFVQSGPNGCHPDPCLISNLLHPFDKLVLDHSSSCVRLSYSTLSTLFQDQYGFFASQSGLAYLGMTVGFTISHLTAGLISDGYIHKKTRNGEIAANPEHRLPILMIGAAMLPAGFIVYGWGLQYRVHWIVPNIGSALISLGVMYNFMPVQMYVVDSCTIYSVSATGAVGIIRSIITTVFPLARDPLYASLDYGWGNTLLAFIVLTSLPMAIIFCKYGEKWRLRCPPKL